MRGRKRCGAPAEMEIYQFSHEVFVADKARGKKLGGQCYKNKDYHENRDDPRSQAHDFFTSGDSFFNKSLDAGRRQTC